MNTVARHVATFPAVSADMPYFGVKIAPENRWIRALDLEEVVASFCAERDCGNGGMGWGASDLGGRLPLHMMSASATRSRVVGYVKYNGDVVITEADVVGA